MARDSARLEDVIQALISVPGVVRTRTEVTLRERVPYPAASAGGVDRADRSDVAFDILGA